MEYADDRKKWRKLSNTVAETESTNTEEIAEDTQASKRVPFLFQGGEGLRSKLG